MSVYERSVLTSIDEIDGLTSFHILPSPKHLSPLLPLTRNHLRHLIVRSIPVKITSEESHDGPEIVIIRRYGNVTDEDREYVSTGRTREWAYWTQGAIRSVYHSGKIVLLRTRELLDINL